MFSSTVSHIDILLSLRFCGGLRSMLAVLTLSRLLKGLKGVIVGFRCAAMQ